MIYIGIDPGVKTGVAIWDSDQKKFIDVYTVGIIAAMRHVLRNTAIQTKPIEVRYEDARLRRYFGSSGREKLQGAGSIKRDCSIWEEFLEELYQNKLLTYRKISPLSKGRKVNATTFAKMARWSAPTNEHGRDAAMLVIGC